MTSVLESLNSALHRAFTADENVLMLGEDILDPYGGAFKVTRGLSEAFPDRVLSSPISEAGIVGVASGMALRGLRPVVEIMFGDFLTLAADQLINHTAKFQWMYNETVTVPLVIRTPMGGRRGYGPTHSQTLEKHFLGTPGLCVLAPCAVGDPGELLASAILLDNEPVLFIENKLLYLLQIQDPKADPEFEIRETRSALKLDKNGQPFFYPTYMMKIRGAPPASLTLATYGYTVELARRAALRLAYENEIFVEIVAPTQLAPFELSGILESIGKTQRLLTLEEGSCTLGWGAEVLAQASQTLGPRLTAAERLAAADLPVPASGPLENEILPDVDQVVEFCQKILHNR